MIARPLPAPRQPSGGRPGVRTSRNATAARRARTRRLRYRLTGRIIAALSALTALVLDYLALVANTTRLRYEVGKLQHERTRLGELSVRYEDEIAQLASHDRLEAIAARLGMREPRAYVVVELPKQRRLAAAPPGGIAALLPVVQSLVGVSPK